MKKAGNGLEQLLIFFLNEFSSVLFAGVIIWLFQHHYTERAKLIGIYSERIRKVEDEFFEYAKQAKYGFYRLCIGLTNESGISQNDVQIIVQGIQKAIDIVLCNNVVLKKYQKPMNTVFTEYNEFSDLFMDAQSKNIGLEGVEEYNVKLVRIKDDIFAQFDNIEYIYFNKKKGK